MQQRQPDGEAVRGNAGEVADVQQATSQHISGEQSAPAPVECDVAAIADAGSSGVRPA